jgi:hypothetical protein
VLVSGLDDPRRAPLLSLIVWVEGIVFISQIVIFGVMLVNWTEALEVLIEFRSPRLARLVRFCIAGLVGVLVSAVLAVCSFVSVSLVNLSLELLVGSFWDVIILAFRVILSFLLLMNFLTCSCCMVGFVVLWRSNRRAEAISLVKSMSFFLLMMLGLALRGMYWYRYGNVH